MNSNYSHRGRVAVIVTTLAEVFNRELSAPTIEAYWLTLSAVEPDQLERAFTAALSQCRFMPTPAELLELAGVPSSNDRAMLAWSIVLKSVHLGPYKHVSFVDDRITNATIRSLGGWPTFLSRLNSAESEKWVRKEFLDTYRSLHHAQVDGELCRPLVGLAGGTFADGRTYLPPISEVRTNLPALPAPPRAHCIESTARLLELKRA